MFVEDDNDSYRAATEGKGISDDNRTATGTIKVPKLVGALYLFFRNWLIYNMIHLHNMAAPFISSYPASPLSQSYRKTPFNSRYNSQATSLNEPTYAGQVAYIDPATAPADEHRVRFLFGLIFPLTNVIFCQQISKLLSLKHETRHTTLK